MSRPLSSQIAEWRDYPDWHRGRWRYALWCIPVEDDAVLARWRQARRLLDGWLHAGQRRQPHITLFVCGFPTDQPVRHDDDFPHSALHAQLHSLRQQPLPAFSLQIGALASFSCAPFLQVSDPQQQLKPLRQQLASHSPEIRFAPYHPHLTLGLYRQSRPFSQLPAELQQLPPIELPVRELHYCSYAARDLLGGLRVEERVTLFDAKDGSR